MAFRVRTITEAELAINAIVALDEPQNAIIFIDCSYISDLTNSYNLFETILQTLKKEVEQLNIVSLSASFPSSPAIGMIETPQFTTNEIKAGYIQQKELELYYKISEKYEVLYGDYASIHPIPISSTDSEGRWSARIDFATDDSSWGIFRMPTQHGEGYQPVATHIVNSGMINYIPDCWGKDRIIEASEGQVFGKSPSKWVGVRANTHMRHQISLTSLHGELDEFV
ncbi:hypothetical protein HPC37_04545 [Pasteurellaceae bacterium 20609_3]|nr:hypothetical protein [Spirabiliibacterium mucosae]